MEKSLIIIGIIILTLTNLSFAEKPKPFNRVVVIIDSSGSFKNHQYEAIERVQELIEKMANRKERRYEAPDEVYIISLDAKPEVIWAGKREHLGQLTKPRLSKLFNERSRYSDCTDVASAFNLAAHKLNREPAPTAKWLFVFSDLMDEPETSSGNCRVPERPSLPSDKIKWDNLADTSIGVFWASDSQIMAWEEALADKGLSIKFYDRAEALNAELPPPPKARKRMGVEEREEAKKQLIERGKRYGVFLAELLIGVVIFLIAIVFVVNYFNHRSRTPIANNTNRGRR